MDVSIILAAGEGTRMKSNMPKVLHKVAGKPILEYVINASRYANMKKNIVIIGHGADKIRESFKEQDLIFENQPIGEGAPYGTGYAVMQGVDHIEDGSNVLILCGDTPLIKGETLKAFVNSHKENNCYGSILTTVVENPTGYGRIKRDDSGNVLAIVEEKDCNYEEKLISEINSGIYCFNGKALKDSLKKIDNNNAQGELYITDVIGILREEEKKIGGFILEDPDEIYGVNSRIQLAESENIMKKRINDRHMVNGVTLINPENTYIEEDVVIGKDTIIYPNVVLQGSTEIGNNCKILSNSRIEDSKIGDFVEVESSLIEKSILGEGCKIGPNAHLRPKSTLGNGVKIGNFVEVKNSTLGNKSKAGHLAYIGDAIVGDNVNIGCGVIFANYNGREKNITEIGDNVFIGSNSTLIAPLKIRDKAYIAGGSTIVENIEENSLSIARARQVNKLDWVSKKGF